MQLMPLELEKTFKSKALAKTLVTMKGCQLGIYFALKYSQKPGTSLHMIQNVLSNALHPVETVQGKGNTKEVGSVTNER